MKRWLRQNSLSLTFIVFIGMLIVSITLASAKSTGVCGGDPNFTTCLRNWVNAGGNIASVFVAGVALFIAWGQLRANAVMAALPVVNQRIITIKAGRFVALTTLEHMDGLANALAEVADRLQRKADDLNLPDLGDAILSEWNAILAQTPQVRKIADEILDADLEENLSSIIQIHISLQNEVWPVISHFKELTDAMDAEDNDPRNLAESLSVRSRRTMANIKIGRSARQIRQIEKLCRAKSKELDNVANELGNILNQAKATRANLLRAL